MFGDLGKIMKIAGQMKEKMPEMQEKLLASRFTAQAGDGAVSATVNGKLTLVDIKISPEAMTDGELAGDAERLGDSVKAAISAAQQQASEAAAQAMDELTGGMNIPGMPSMLP